MGAGACRPVEQEGDTQVTLDRPDSNSDLLEAWWLEYESTDLERMASLAQAMAEVLDVEALKDRGAWPDGEQRRFGAAHLDVVDLYAPPDDDGSWKRPDPAKARPVFIATRYRCALDQLARILVHRDQDALYDDAYVTYARTWKGDGDAFLRGEIDDLAWTFDMVATYPGAGEFNEFAEGQIRRLPLPEGKSPGWIGDSYLASRVWLPFPAARENDGIDFAQDYQLEIYVPWEGGDIVHLYGMWRELDTPFGDFEGDLVSRLTVNNLKSWDDQTQALCDEGKP
ncbi:MAG: hypothetical protein H6732_04210 [Alphaproteobacteria bacterium]|nr:hypothetical protein [Alphaproteobacteria bacterium]